MAKGKKETFKEMFSDLQSQKISAPKPVATIEERQYFLIVCEGERTEPIYFDYLRNLLPRNLLQTIEIIGQGKNTIKIVEKAIKERNARAADPVKPRFDEVWAIFDKDDFPNDHFDKAVTLANQNGIKNGSSNQAFELWYVLHFQFLQTAIAREAYFSILTKILGFKYEKNSRQVLEEIFKRGRVRQAIKWAQQLEKMHEGKKPSASWPSTNVYKLVDHLLVYTKWHGEAKKGK
jgi:hypothetical protein